MTDHLNHLLRVSITFPPSPLVELKNLSRHLGGPRIFIKRDDLTGLALGGNKTRKLEFLLGQAKAQDCDTVITGGPSNPTTVDKTRRRQKPWVWNAISPWAVNNHPAPPVTCNG